MIPTNSEILALLDQLDLCIADDLESQWLDFKPWKNPKDDMRLAVEYAVCFANAEGGVIVFGVEDNIRGRAAAIHGAEDYDLDVWKRGIYAATVPSLTVQLEELPVPEGTRKLLVVRVPKGTNPPYGTAQGLFKKRVGKNCMPLDPAGFAQARVKTGSVDWSGEAAEGVGLDDLDPVEISRAKTILRSRNPESELLKLSDQEFLQGLEVVRRGKVTHAGLLLFGRDEILARHCPQNQIHYVHHVSDTKVSRNDVWRMGLLKALDRIENIFLGPVNPEEELSIGLFKQRIPAFPVEVVRESVLNAVTHRDYSDPGEILIRHGARDLVVTSPGGFVGGITLDNILRHEPVSRNRTLANIFVKLRLVESAGTGRKKIFIRMLGYGKQSPRYESDGFQVTLHLFDGSYDKRMAAWVSRWNRQGHEIDLDALLILNGLKEQPYMDAKTAASLLQLELEPARRVLDRLANPRVGILERRGGTRAATYHLTKGVAKDLLGKVAYTKTKGVNPARYAEIVREFVSQHGAITPKECRELLGLGSSASARVEVSRYLRKWSQPGGFLKMRGHSPKNKYVFEG